MNLSFDVFLLDLNNWRYLSSSFPDPEDVADPQDHWHSCKLDINCSPYQLTTTKIGFNIT